jgi:dihydromethanopterin reductase (acceptor)
MHILWCVTGAGHLLEESRDFMQKSRGTHTITVAFSRAGHEVARMYGLLARIERDFE